MKEFKLDNNWKVIIDHKHYSAPPSDVEYFVDLTCDRCVKKNKLMPQLTSIGMKRKNRELEIYSPFIYCQNCYTQFEYSDSHLKTLILLNLLSDMDMRV